MTTHDRFTPRGSISPEQLKAYAEGRLEGAAAHEVEEHLEADPFLRDAADGLRTPGAMSGLDNLARHRPNGNGLSWAAWTLGAVVIVMVGVAWYAARSTEEVSTDHAPLVIVPAVTAEPEAEAIQPAEINAAVEIPESLQVGHASTDRHARAQFTSEQGLLPSPVERVVVDTVTPRSIHMPRSSDSLIASMERQQRPSVTITYYFGLKLVHPRELYERDPVVDISAMSVQARYRSRQEMSIDRRDQLRVSYRSFMHDALGQFARNKHKGCLEDLRFALVQYPDDVNMLFYAGLCSYNLGMYERAEKLLRKVATHSIRVFDEESEWYHALTLERLGRTDEAQAEYRRIAGAGGFYAERAGARISLH